MCIYTNTCVCDLNKCIYFISCLCWQFRSGHVLDPNSSLQPEDCLSTFLKAVELLNIPAFENLDLAQVGFIITSDNSFIWHQYKPMENSDILFCLFVL